jgi:hypothetical protein
LIDAVAAALTRAGLLWTLLELVSYFFLAKGWFIHLLEGNPKLAGQREKQEKTAVQMCPRLVCFVHNMLQVIGTAVASIHFAPAVTVGGPAEL